MDFYCSCKTNISGRQGEEAGKRSHRLKDCSSGVCSLIFSLLLNIAPRICCYSHWKPPQTPSATCCYSRSSSLRHRAVMLPIYSWKVNFVALPPNICRWNMSVQNAQQKSAHPPGKVCPQPPLTMRGWVSPFHTQITHTRDRGFTE